MINRDDIEEGDTVHFRNGGKEIAGANIMGVVTIGGMSISDWADDGMYYRVFETGFDIIRVEKKPKPRVKVEYAAFYWENGLLIPSSTLKTVKNGDDNADKYFKITITEGQKPEIEEV